MKEYVTKPIHVKAFKWDGEPNDYVKLVGPVRGDEKPCNFCGLLLEKHGELVNPKQTATPFVCVGEMVVVWPDMVSEAMYPTEFEEKFEEV